MYEQMFSHYDKDKSGSIDANELKALLAELGRQVRRTEWKKEKEKEGRGKKGREERRKGGKWSKGNEGKEKVGYLCCFQASDEVMETLMKELDKDGNGLVEFPEFLHGMDILNDLSAHSS